MLYWTYNTGITGKDNLGNSRDRVEQGANTCLPQHHRATKTIPTSMEALLDLPQIYIKIMEKARIGLLSYKTRAIDNMIQEIVKGRNWTNRPINW